MLPGPVQVTELAQQAAQPFLEVHHAAQAAAAELESAAPGTEGSQLRRELLDSMTELSAGVPVRVSFLTDGLEPSLAGFCAALLHRAAEPAARAARLLRHFWALPQQAEAARLELELAAASRPGCAWLGCANMDAPAGRPQRCSGCGAAAYCSAACQLTAWRAGHREACPTLRAMREKSEL